MKKQLSAPFSEADIRELSAGDQVYLSGTVYTGRDAAHKRLVNMLDNGEKLPVDLNGQAIYFVGPCPAPPGRPIGSAGPTTSAPVQKVNAMANTAKTQISFFNKTLFSPAIYKCP